MATRAQRRALGGKRDIRRRYRKDVMRILEMTERGFSPSVIAGSTGLSEALVLLILDEARKVQRKYEGEE